MCQPFAVQVSEVIFDCNVTPSVPVKKLTNQTVVEIIVSPETNYLLYEYMYVIYVKQGPQSSKNLFCVPF